MNDDGADLAEARARVDVVRPAPIAAAVPTATRANPRVNRMNSSFRSELADPERRRAPGSGRPRPAFGHVWRPRIGSPWAGFVLTSYADGIVTRRLYA